MEIDSYSLTDIMRIMNVNRSTLSLYANSDIVPPEADPGIGRGSRRLYTRQNILEFALVRAMNNGGVKLEFAGEVLKSLRKVVRHYSLDPKVKEGNGRVRLANLYNFDFCEEGSTYLIVYNPQAPKISDFDVSVRHTEKEDESFECPAVRPGGQKYEMALVIDVTFLRNAVRERIDR